MFPKPRSSARCTSASGPSGHTSAASTAPTPTSDDGPDRDETEEPNEYVERAVAALAVAALKARRLAIACGHSAARDPATWHASSQDGATIAGGSDAAFVAPPVPLRLRTELALLLLLARMAERNVL